MVNSQLRTIMLCHSYLLKTIKWICPALLVLCHYAVCKGQVMTLNETDSLGLRQGKWIFPYGVIDESWPSEFSSGWMVECTYSNDTLVGEYFITDSTDRIRYEVLYEHGYRNGPGTFWDTDGRLFRRCEYVNDSIVTVENFIDGRLSEVLRFNSGKLHGGCWNLQKGSLRSERIYIHGRLSREHIFYPDQSIRQDIVYSPKGIVLKSSRYPKGEFWRNALPSENVP